MFFHYLKINTKLRVFSPRNDLCSTEFNFREINLISFPQFIDYKISSPFSPIPETSLIFPGVIFLRFRVAEQTTPQVVQSTLKILSILARAITIIDSGVRCAQYCPICLPPGDRGPSFIKLNATEVLTNELGVLTRCRL